MLAFESRVVAAGPAYEENRQHLLAAIDAFDGSAFYRRALGDDIVGYFSKIKRAELDRFNQEVTDWEQREYFDAF